MFRLARKSTIERKTATYTISKMKIKKIQISLMIIWKIEILRTFQADTSIENATFNLLGEFQVKSFYV